MKVTKNVGAYNSNKTLNVKCMQRETAEDKNKNKNKINFVFCFSFSKTKTKNKCIEVSNALKRV